MKHHSKHFDRATNLTPWVNKRGQIQLHAQLATGGMFNRIIINVRTSAAHNSVPPRDKWEVVQVHPIEDTTVDVRELARGYIRMHAAVFGHPYEASYDGLWDMVGVEHG